MKTIKMLLALLGLCFYSISSNAQSDSTVFNAFKSLIGNIELKVDTTSPPEDSLTLKIRIVRSELGPINWDNVIKLSLEDQQSKDTTRPEEYYKRLQEAFQTGYAHHITENILINLYRQCFTEKEVDQLVKFYKTPLGKKWFINLILITTTSSPAIQDIVHETGYKLELEMRSEGKIK